MAEWPQREEKIGFKAIQLLKGQSLGVGSCGKVFRAKCDDLFCAAKLVDTTTFDSTAQHYLVIPPERKHWLSAKTERFEQECEFLSSIRHPNIVQFLGIYQDPDTGLPALLMEQMDDSLTHFLESSPQPIPYHIQVNISHDIALALSYLHSNGIVHRDLSSNNVLLIGNVRAKVTDFGMARLGDMNPRTTDCTLTMCPGTDVYMPPEAIQDKPVYTEKIDCFSFGVVVLQILTREFPEPGDWQEKIEIEHVGLVEKRISEKERRQNHISKIDPNDPLLAIVLNCLSDKDVERPSAKELCRCIASLKRNDKYSESAGVDEELSCEITQRYTECKQIESLQRIVQEKNRMIIQQNSKILTLTAQLEREMSKKERAQTRISELELQFSKKDQGDHQETEGSRSSNTNQNKLYRKKFGFYPLYRHRYNGVKWRSCESSDEEEPLSRSVNQVEFRGSRNLATANNKHKNPKPIKRKSSPSCDEENDEESEPHMALAIKRQKKLTKHSLRPGDYDFNSTTSEASDVESLTDCSLYWSENQ